MVKEKKELTPVFDAEALKTWRERMGWSQYEAADELGCARESIRNWESGESEVPAYIDLATRALALGERKRGSEQP